MIADWPYEFSPHTGDHQRLHDIEPHNILRQRRAMLVSLLACERRLC